jgi:DNA polymerase III delta prime subunit
MNMTDTQWVEKYRPQTFKDLVLPPVLSKNLKTLTANKGGMSLMFFGNSGSGKTTVARMISPESTYFINCSLDNSINMVRELPRTCSSVTVFGERRVVVLDEADNLSRDAQAALRGTVEFLSKSTDFIMTANEPTRLMPAIHSRFLPIPFDFLASEDFKQSLLLRLRFIATAEGHHQVSDQQLRTIVTQYFPDIRKMINALQYALLSEVT